MTATKQEQKVKMIVTFTGSGWSATIPAAGVSYYHGIIGSTGNNSGFNKAFEGCQAEYARQFPGLVAVKKKQIKRAPQHVEFLEGGNRIEIEFDMEPV